MTSTPTTVLPSAPARRGSAGRQAPGRGGRLCSLRALPALALASALVLGLAAPAWGQFTGTGAGALGDLASAQLPTPAGMTTPAYGLCQVGQGASLPVSWQADPLAAYGGAPLVGAYDLRVQDNGATIAQVVLTAQPGRQPPGTYTVSFTCPSGSFLNDLVVSLQALTSASGGFRSAIASTQVWYFSL